MNCPYGPAAIAPFESVKGYENDVYQTLFKEDLEGEGVLTNPRFILRMPVEKAEAVWTIIFKSKSRAIKCTTPG